MTALVPDDDLPDIPTPRAPWLVTLADLALLLVGFFVFLQASRQLDTHTLARGIRAGFGVREASAATPPAVPPAADAMAVASGAMTGFAPGSATLPQAAGPLIGWARDAGRDARVSLRIAGAVDGTPGDVDAATGSGAVLAADRARAVAAALLLARAVPADRLVIAPAARAGGRGVTVTTVFAGSRQ